MISWDSVVGGGPTLAAIDNWSSEEAQLSLPPGWGRCTTTDSETADSTGAALLFITRPTLGLLDLVSCLLHVRMGPNECVDMLFEDSELVLTRVGFWAVKLESSAKTYGATGIRALPPPREALRVLGPAGGPCRPSCGDPPLAEGKPVIHWRHRTGVGDKLRCRTYLNSRLNH